MSSMEDSLIIPLALLLALDESVWRNPTQQEYLLEREGHLLWSARGLEPISVHIRCVEGWQYYM